MRPLLVALLLVGAILAPAIPATAQDGEETPTSEGASQRGSGRSGGASEDASDRGSDRGGAPDDADASDQGGRGRPAEGENRGRGGENRPPTPVPIGAFEVNARTGEAAGEFVSFRYGADGVQSFTADGTPLFNLSSARAGGETIREVEVRGSRMQVESDTYRLVVHDNPAAVSRIRADEPVALDFLGDAEITPAQGDDRSYAFKVGGLAGKIKGDKITVNGSRLVAEGDLLVLLDSARASVDAHRPAILDAIGKGRVGAEASFNRIDEDVAQDIVSYGNVTITTVKADKGNLTVLVDGHGFDGRVLVLNVDGRVVGASDADQLDILFDNQSMRRADSLTDVLDPDDDGLHPEYYLVFDPLTESFQLVVSVPHYSVHTLSVTTVAFLPPPSVVFGVVAGVALLVPAAFALFGRKRR